VIWQEIVTPLLSPHSPEEGNPVNRKIIIRSLKKKTRNFLTDWISAGACPREIGGGNEEEFIFSDNQ